MEFWRDCHLGLEKKTTVITRTTKNPLIWNSILYGIDTSITQFSCFFKENLNSRPFAAMQVCTSLLKKFVEF
jgi:hypothetical protein